MQLTEMFNKDRIRYLLIGVVLDTKFMGVEKPIKHYTFGQYAVYHHIHKDSIEIAVALNDALEDNLGMITQFLPATASNKNSQ